MDGGDTDMMMGPTSVLTEDGSGFMCEREDPLTTTNFPTTQSNKFLFQDMESSHLEIRKDGGDREIMMDPTSLLIEDGRVFKCEIQEPVIKTNNPTTQNNQLSIGQNDFLITEEEIVNEDMCLNNIKTESSSPQSMRMEDDQLELTDGYDIKVKDMDCSEGKLKRDDYTETLIDPLSLPIKTERDTELEEPIMEQSFQTEEFFRESKKQPYKECRASSSFQSPSSESAATNSQNTVTLLALGRQIVFAPPSCSAANVSRGYGEQQIAGEGQRRHSEERIEKRHFTCNLCGKDFKKPYTLTIHIRSHTGERPYECSQCSKSFSTRSVLTRHMHSHTGYRPNKCSLCEKSFAAKNTLTKHMRTHTGERPYKCSQCKQSFSMPHSLSEHMHLHTGERPYKCSLCCESFKQRGSLKWHLQTHTADLPNKCSLCWRSFKLRSGLTTHMRSHTGDQP